METIVLEKDRIAELRNELLERRAKTDIVVRADKLRMLGNGSLTVPIPQSSETVTAKPTGWAEGQIAEYIGMPLAYYRRMTGHPELFSYNVNFWLDRSRDLRMVRIYKDEVIAYLSNAYRAIDNYDIATTTMTAAQETLEKQGLTLQVHRAYLTERVFDLTLTSLETPIEYESGEKYRLGMHVRNSEVGAASFAVEAMVVRHVCSNGQIFGEPITQRHIGRRLNDGNVWSQRTQELNNLTTVSQINDMTRYAFNLNEVRAFTDKAEGLKAMPIEATVQYINATERLLDLTELESKSIWKKVRENNRYELVQAITSTANDMFTEGKNPERATELQHLGGELVEKPSIWDRIEARAKDKKHN
jgi:hypothetical protein